MIREKGNVMSMNASWENAEAIQKLGFIPARTLVYKSRFTIAQYQSGELRPLKTRYKHLNDNLTGGFFIGDIITIAGASSSGKSHTAQLLEEDFMNPVLNPNYKDVVLVRYNWEMSVLNQLLRRLGREMDMEIEDIRKRPFSGPEQKIYDDICEKESAAGIFYHPDIVNPHIFYDQLKKFLDYIKSVDPKKHAVITLDHCALINPENATSKTAIDQLMVYLNILKQLYNVTFIILSQLNRSINERTKDREHAPNRQDLYQSDTMFHTSDAVIVLHRPEFLHLESYMAFNENSYPWLNNYKTENKRAFKTAGLVFWHYLKIRNEKRKSRNERIHVVELGYVFDETWKLGTGRDGKSAAAGEQIERHHPAYYNEKMNNDDVTPPFDT